MMPKGESLPQNFSREIQFGPVLFCILDLETGCFVDCNPAVRELLGFTPDQLISQPYLDFIHPNDRSDIQREIEDDRVSCENNGREIRLRCSDGSFKWLGWQCSRLTEQRYLYAVATDISYLKQVELDLIESLSISERQIRHLTLSAEIGRVLTTETNLDRMLQRCCEQIVRHLGAAFARIWTINESRDCLHLKASAGLYTNLNGSRSRISSDGDTKIWQAYQSKSPFITNHVNGDPHVEDQGWVEREKIRSFGGYPLVLGDQVIGVFAMFSRIAIEPDEFESMELLAHQIALGISRKWSEVKQKTLQQRLGALTGHLQQVQEQEKMHLARELHDELGQQLTAATLELYNLRENCRERMGDEPFSDMERDFNEINQALQTMMDTTESMVMGLRPVILDDLGLLAALEWLIDQYADQSAFKIDFIDQVGRLTLNHQQSIALYRIAQECLTNIARHAKATQASLRLERRTDSVDMTIADNGIGLVDSEIDQRKSFGILGMKERANLFGWELSIRGSTGRGTTVILRIPNKNEGPDNDD